MKYGLEAVRYGVEEVRSSNERRTRRVGEGKCQMGDNV